MFKIASRKDWHMAKEATAKSVGRLEDLFSFWKEVQ
jgi:hypothetical protein